MASAEDDICRNGTFRRVAVRKRDAECGGDVAIAEHANGERCGAFGGGGIDRVEEKGLRDVGGVRGIGEIVALIEFGDFVEGIHTDSSAQSACEAGEWDGDFL